VTLGAARWLALQLPFLLGVSTAMAGQERLIGSRTLGVAASFESIWFGDGGVQQTSFAGIDTVHLTRAQQLTVPLTVATPIGGGWRLDLTTLYGSGRVTFIEAGTGQERVGALSGLSDVRVRASGRFLADALTLTFGANVPTGRTTLTGNEFSTLRALAAPGLGMGSSPVGAGPSGTMGAVLGQHAGAWDLAFGASYEHRGKFQPVAALTAGAPSADYRPGGVFRVSVGADRSVGPHRASVAAALDVFTDDRLRGASSGDGVPSRTVTLATVRLGPVFTGDAQFRIAAQRFRDLTLYASYLWRAPFARDGLTAEGSSGQYVASGLRVAIPLAVRSDVFLSGEGRWHSGLGIDQGLPTAGVRSVGLTAGVSTRRGLVELQPYFRAQAGSLRQRAPDTPVRTNSFRGVAVGAVLISRF